MKYTAPQMKVFDIETLNKDILAAACSSHCTGIYCEKKYSNPCTEKSIYCSGPYKNSTI